MLYCSDDVYLLKIIIAIIDHNHHIALEYLKSSSGEIQYHRVWRRRSQHWKENEKRTIRMFQRYYS